MDPLNDVRVGFSALESRALALRALDLRLKGQGDLNILGSNLFRVWGLGVLGFRGFRGIVPLK